MPVATKVAAPGILGAAVTVLVYVVGLFGVEMSPEVAAGIVTLAGTTLGYSIKETRVEMRPKA